MPFFPSTEAITSGDGVRHAFALAYCENYPQAVYDALYNLLESAYDAKDNHVFDAAVWARDIQALTVADIAAYIRDYTPHGDDTDADELNRAAEYLADYTVVLHVDTDAMLVWCLDY